MKRSNNVALPNRFSEKISAVIGGQDVLEDDDLGLEQVPNEVETQVHVFGEKSILADLTASQVNCALVVYVNDCRGDRVVHEIFLSKVDEPRGFFSGLVKSFVLCLCGGKRHGALLS